MKNALSLSVMLLSLACEQRLTVPQKTTDKPQEASKATSDAPPKAALQPASAPASVPAPRALPSLDKWVELPPLQPESLNDVAFGNGLYVAVGGLGGRLLTSSDGVNWSVGTVDSSAQSIGEVEFGGGLFVLTATGEDYKDNRVYTSTDGKSWKRAEKPYDLYEIHFFDNRFIVADGQKPGELMISSDGASWATLKGNGISFPSDYETSDAALIAFGDGVYVYTNTRDIQDEDDPTLDVFFSDDASHWKTSSLKKIDGRAIAVSHFKDQFVLLMGGGQLYTSRDGKIWSKGEDLKKSGLVVMGACGDTFLLFHNDSASHLSSTKDLKTWEEHTFRSSKGISSFACGDGSIVVVGSAGVMLVAK